MPAPTKEFIAYKVVFCLSKMEQYFENSHKNNVCHRHQRVDANILSALENLSMNF